MLNSYQTRPAHARCGARVAALAVAVALATGTGHAAEPAPASATAVPSAADAGIRAANASPSATADAPKLDLNDTSSYRIRSGDTIEMKVYQEDDLNSKVRVDEEGGVVLPLIGRVALQGITAEAARKLVSDKYEADFLHHPQVSLMVTEFAPRRFVVMGQVARPGIYEIPTRERLNLLQAIAMAGGYTKIADPSKVRVRRNSDKGEEVLRFNAKALATSGTGEVPLIQSDDNITVGESAF